MGSKKGFTLVELLTAVTIIAMFIGILIPSLRMVRGVARDAKQRAQLTTIEMAISAFRNDYGDYPPSSKPLPPPDYNGAQMLTEALVGWDLMGFHPDSGWNRDGDNLNTVDVEYPWPLNQNTQAHIDNLKERRGPYLELATADAFKLEDLFHPDAVIGGSGWTYVLCDVYKIKKITITAQHDKNQIIDTVKAGTPLLYYKANTSSKTIGNLTLLTMQNNIYNAYDNMFLINQGRLSDGKEHPIAGDGTTNEKSYKNFYGLDKDGGIANSKISTNTWKWPHRPDSYILISAGADGLYGTQDDITNFK